jgi:integrase
MQRRRLNDAIIKALKPPPKGKRLVEWDGLCPGFGVRVTDTGSKSFIVYTRFRGVPSRRTIGGVDKITLKDARTKARAWLEAAGRGEDPAADAREANAVTFGAVAEEFIERHVSKYRNPKDAEREIQSELVARWRKRPIASIKRKEVIKLVEKIADRAPGRAHHVLSHARLIFGWALDREIITSSPCERIAPKKIIGKRKVSTRVLSDDKLRALWDATEQIGYPYGPLYRLLMLTGCRKMEIGEARWGEVNLEKRLLTIPPERFKTEEVHIVPLSDDAAAILAELPRFARGDLLFTFSGEGALNGWSKNKRRLDKLMGASGWVTHDIRRTVRTRLSPLTDYNVAELVIGHGKKGMGKVYDQHDYLDEMRKALDAWAARLRSIVNPPEPGKVIDIRKRA